MPIKKPDFRTGGGGCRNPFFLPEAFQRELLDHLVKSPLNAAQKSALIKCANDTAQELIEWREVATGKEMREQLEEVSANARRLLASLNKLARPTRDALEVFGGEEGVALKPTVRQALKRASLHEPGMGLGVASAAWDWVEALELASAHTAAQFTIDKQSKPDQARARGYVAALAQKVDGLTGAPPPKDRAAWFAGFVVRLGEELSLPIGPRVVASGVALHIDKDK